MFDRYRKRLSHDLDRWIRRGLVPAENRSVILEDVQAEPGRWSAQGAAAILGAVLLGLAAISFVAANWSELSRLVRFSMIIGALWASYGGAAFAFARSHSAIGHALALLGAALFGGAIALTAQTFNLSAFRNTGILIWAIGALATAVVIPSRPALILAACVGGAWLMAEAFNPLIPAIIWGYPVFMLVAAASASRLQSNVSMNLLALGLGGWLVHALEQVHRAKGFDNIAATASFALICGVIALAAGLMRERGVHGAGVLAVWGAAGAAAGVFLSQIAISDHAGQASLGPIYPVILTVALVLVLALLAWQVRAGALGLAGASALGGAGVISFALPFFQMIAHEALIQALTFIIGGCVFAAGAVLILIGSSPGRRVTGAVGVVLFTAQAIYVYAELFAGLLGTAAFFAAGGVLMIVVSLVLTRIARGLGPKQTSGGGS